MNPLLVVSKINTFNIFQLLALNSIAEIPLLSSIPCNLMRNGVSIITQMLPIFEQFHFKVDQMKDANQSISTSASSNRNSAVSHMFLLWSNDFAKSCHEKRMTQNDVDQVEDYQSFAAVHQRWRSFWEQSANLEQQEGVAGGRLKWTMRKTFQKQLISATVMSFIAYQSNAMMPLIIYLISQYIQEGHLTVHKSVVFIVLIFGLKLLKIFMSMHSEFVLKKIGSSAFACICYSLTEKSLTRLEYSSGELSISQKAALAQYDCSKLIEYPSILTAAIFQMYSFVFTMACLFYISGWQGLVSCVILLALQMIRYFMITIIKRYQKRVNECASDRIKKSTEVINNMKFIKVNALENLFFGKLNTLRKTEVDYLQKYLNLGIPAGVMQYGASRISIVVFILLYSLTGHQLQSALIFSVMLFFRYMGLHKIMNKANNLEDMDISLIKIQHYLSTREIDASYLTRVSSSEAEVAIQVKNGSFYWNNPDRDEDDIIGKMGFSMRNINLTIKRGQFVALIGEFGSGKSSIINAILGEMNNQSSTVNVNGSIAYASQAPWILNDTVKNNILFGEPLDDRRYIKAIHYSRLETDLGLFAQGDATVIGQRGSTLSGGQRARISLARALYRDADIYILDDIFSALDAHVSAFIFQETLVKHLKGKTLILATHLINYLNLVDRVFMIEDGHMQEIAQMKDAKETFEEVIMMRRKSSVKRKSSRDSISISGNISDAVYNLKVPDEGFAPLAPVEKEEMSDSQLFCLFMHRRGGVPYVMGVFIWTVLMVLTNTWLFFWLNQWMQAPNNTDFYYYQIYTLLLLAGLVTIAAHCWMQFNSDFFYQMHKMMVSRLLVAPMSHFETTSIASTMNKLSSDLKKIDSEVVAQFRNLVYFISLSASFLLNSVMAYLRKDEPIMIAVMVGLISVISYYYYFFIVAVKQVHRLEQHSRIGIYSSFGEIMVGANTIRAYQKEGFMKEKQIDVIQRYLMTEKIMAGIHAYSMFIISLIVSSVTTLLFIKLLVFDREDKVEFFLIYNIFALERTLENLQTVLSDFLNSLKYLQYCEELMTIPQEEGYQLIPAGQAFQFGERVDSRWIKQGRIEFQQFSVRYRPELQMVLKGITMSVREREKIGVVGRTGSGKSTTILSLMRILQTHEGRITIDGEDIYDRDLQSLRAGFSVILQEHFLFTGTVRQNIDPLGEFQDQKIIAALEMCGVWQGIKARNGLQTVIEEGGDNFSAGEKQLMNISRTLLNPKRIVLVDEATASIDFQSDAMLQRVIKEHLKQSTIITIAHRIDTILSSDRVLVLDKGKILELDSPSQLLKNSDSIFRKLYKESQNRDSADLNIKIE